MTENNDVKEIQVKIKRHIEQLEEKVKNSKNYWNSTNLKFDKHFVENFINGHYNEIVHHLSQIKHHLEQINYHKKEIDDIQLYLTREANTSSPETQNDSNDQRDKHIKRPEEDKIRSKSRRLARASSLKYVLHWERMLDEQREDSFVNSVKRRPKNEKDEDESNETDVSKVMVKNRVMQFEGIQKPKRISSTYESFLDSSGEKPKRANSFPILEELEDENDIERPKSCTLETCSRNDENDIERPKSSTLETCSRNDSSCENLEKPQEYGLGDSKEDEFVMSSENIEKENDQSDKAGVNITRSEECCQEVQRGEETQDTQLGNEVAVEDTMKIENIPSLPEQIATIAKEVPRKPRIVEVHLKQPGVSTINS